MFNPFLPQKAKIIDVYLDAPQVKVFTLKPEKKTIFEAGQFLELSIPKVGEAPFAFCSSQYNSKQFQIAVQEKGIVTSALFHKHQGDYVGVRGPYGRGFPLKKLARKNLLIVAGGIGLAPLRSVILSILHRRASYKKVQLFYGTKCEEYRVFEKEFPSWQKRGIDVKVTLDQCQLQWKGDIGVITTLFDKYKTVKHTLVFVVGPPIMYKFVLERLKRLKFNDDEIYLSLERRMHCGIGICQHCALLNGKYVCKEGPVFSWAEIKNLPNII